MKTYVKEQQWVDVVDEFKCDRCGHVIKSDHIDAVFELQETFSLDLTGGYGSKYFGDMTNVKADLCEKCLYEIFSPFARTESRL